MKKAIQLTIGLLISGLAIWFAFKTGGVTTAQLIEAFKQTNWLFALPMMALTMASFYWRCFRWKIFLDPIREVPTPRLYAPLMIGFAFNNIFPARAGEFARPFALARQEKIPFAAGFSTIVVERLIDVLTLLVLMVTMPLYITLDHTVVREFTMNDTTYKFGASTIDEMMPKLSIVGGVLLLGIISFVIPAVKNLYLRILNALPLIPVRFKGMIGGLINTFAEGLSSLRSPRAIGMVIVHSAIIWCSVAFSFQLMSWGFPGAAMTFGQSLAFLVVTCVVISIPSSPGFWGLYEFGGMVALLMMGVVPDTPEGASTAFAFTLVVHFLQWAPITAYGLWAAGRLSIKPAAPGADTPGMDADGIGSLEQQAKP